jgi:hypothetical protein
MISDESDEDADTLEDDELLENYFAPGSSERVEAKRKSGADSAAAVQDWPPSPDWDAGRDLDDRTLAWFKANHADWRLQVAAVLRAWVAARTRTLPDIRPPD